MTGAVLTAALALGLGMAGTAQGDPAARKRQVDDSISAVQEDLAGTSAELQSAYAALAATQARLPDAQAELSAAEAARVEAQRKDDELAARLAAAQESEANQTKALAQGQSDIAATESSIGRMAARAYRGGTVSEGLALALDAESPDDFADRYLLVDTVMRSQTGAVARLEQQQAVLANQKLRLEAVREQVAELRREAAANLEVARQAEQQAAARKAEVEQLVAQQTAATATITARQAEEQASLASLQAEQSALEAEIRRIADEERRKAAAARASASRSQSRGAPVAPAPSGGGVLSFPVSAPITSGYGWRMHPIYHTMRLHTGTDFGAACGTPIRAAADGSVVRAGWAGGYGNQILLNNGIIGGNVIATSYNHMSGFAVTSGRVSRGQVIGYVGTTGSSTGCHLHFEVFVNGARTNPIGYL
ncbi:MAG: peptidoglycan DD-metalloendopeptidase family protein [Actinomycetes bacterium]